MADIDFGAAFRRKTDYELTQLAEEIDQLTSEAQSALRIELSNRRVLVPAQTPTFEEPANTIALPPEVKGETTQPIGVAAFIQEITQTYHRDWWLFLQLVIPAVAVAYFAHLGAQTEIRAIRSHLPIGPELLKHKLEIDEMWLVNILAYTVSWIAFCYTFAGICSAMRQIKSGPKPAIGECFREVRGRTGAFLGLSLLLLFVLAGSFALCSILMLLVTWFSSTKGIHISSVGMFVMSCLVVGLALLVSARFGLSIPAFVLEGSTVSGSMFRSDELTEGQWPKLVALLAKALIGGYVAGMMPYWLANWFLIGLRVPWWTEQALFLLSLSAVSLVEPMLFLGFTALYFQQTVRVQKSMDKTMPASAYSGARTG